MRIDLHTHSVVSDGTDTPTELVANAAAAGLGAVALTDHDTFDGLAEAQAAGERLGIEVVPGMELSCSRAGQSVHLLAYGADPTDAALAEEMVLVRSGRTGRLRPVLAKLAELGVPVSRRRCCPSSDQPVGGPTAHRRRAGGRRSRPGPQGGVRPVPGRRRSGSRGPVRDRHRPRHRPGARRRWGRGDRPPLGPRSGGSCCRRRCWRSWSPSRGWTASRWTTKITTPSPGPSCGHWPSELGVLATGSSDYHGTGKVDHDLGVNMTDPETYARLLELVARRIAATR